jgi:hypothetical protein
LAEVLVKYPDVINGEDGVRYSARACAAQVSDQSWHGWIEFETDDGRVIRTPRETTQPNRADAKYWATGITPVYLDGALRRALRPLTLRTPPLPEEPAFDEPAPDFVEPRESVPTSPAVDAVLDPFAVYAKSEQLLRRQLGALSAWHLVNIVRVYGIGTEGDPNRMLPLELVDAIVNAARSRVSATPPR